MEAEITTNKNKFLKSSTTAAIASSSNNNNNLKENNNNANKEKEQRDRELQENGHGKMDAARKANGEKKPIRLASPVGATPINWHWSEKEKNNIGIEVIELVRFTCFHFSELEIPSLKSKLENVDHTNYDQVRSLAKKFNKAVKENAQNPKENPSKPRHKEFFHQILTRCYNRAVENEKALNKHYEAFSSQTYGETSYERMQMIIEELKPDSKDIFVDLGSGVGQLVVHMAGMTSVQKAIGIEISPLPSKFGRKLETEFKKWMNWFGHPFRPFELKQGDFLSEEHRKLITEEATIIFINNYAFKSDLETRIKRELLSDLRDGTRIISTKPYVPLNKQNAAITNRQLSDISVITDITEMKPCPNPCSWTSAYVPYYLHTISRAKLENYFLQLRNSSLRAKSSDTGSRRSSTPNSKASNSRESSVGRTMRDKSSENVRVNGNGEDVWSVRYGPTTRRKWNDYVNELEMQKKKKRSGGQNTSSASSSENASTAASTPAATSGSSNSQLTNSSTNGSELATTTTIANVGQSTSITTTSMDTFPSIEAADKEEKKLTISAEKEETEMAKMPITEPSEHHKNQMMEDNGTINNYPLLRMKPIEFPSTIAGTSSSNQSTPTTVTVPLENNNREIVSPKFEPISPVKQSSSTKRAPTKRSYERKDRNTTTTSTGGMGRGRPRKTDKVGSHATPKLPRLSDDARDGIELMHQMTCAIQSGKPMDTASILADMVNQNNSKMCGSVKTLMDISPPFPNLENNTAGLGPSTSASSSAIRHSNQSNQDVHQKQQRYAIKYPGLNKFIDGFRRIYENFFDEIYSTHQQQPSAVKDDYFLQSDSTIANQFHNYRTTFDQTPVKSSFDELAEIGSGVIHPREISINGTTSLASTTEEHGGRISELQKRIQNRRKKIANKWAEMQNEVMLLNVDIDALTTECRQQDDTNQHIAHQQQLQQQQLVQQQHQQQLIAAAQAQLATAAAQAQEQQSVAAAAATVVQQAQAAQQVNQAAATVSNQLELMINEMREHYNRQLAAQNLLNQISSLGLLNVIAPQEIAALQNIATGAAMNLSGAHQISPVAAAAAIMHSPVATSSTQPTLSLLQLSSSSAQNQIENNESSVQNFLATLDTMNQKNSSKGNNLSTSSNVNGTVNDTNNISANVAAVAAELAYTTKNHGLNYANAVNTQPSVHSLSLHQVSQNFSCHQSIPSSSVSAEIPSQISRESTVAEIVAEVAALPATRKPFKPRPPRTGGGNKRNGQNAQKQQQQTAEDPKKQEEIERQIKDIVAKALEVDSAAKSAEKDRKARGGEKRTSREKTTGSGGNVLPLNSSTSLSTTSSYISSLADIKPTLIATVQPLPSMVPPSSIEYQVKAETNAIMQNFLSTAQKQLAQQQQQAGSTPNGGGMAVTINRSNNITPCGTPHSHHQPATPTSILDGKRTPLNGNNNLGNSTIDFRQAMATLTPTAQSPSIGIGGIHQQQHFAFTPSSVSLAIQGMASNTFSSAPTGLQIAASKLIQTPTSLPSSKPLTSVGTFLHPGESCSPPFISLNLPPNTCALGPPPTNVVVKVESKVPAPGSAGGGHVGLS